MLKKFEDLVLELEDLSIEINFIRDNFIAIEEAHANGANELPRNAITIPCKLLKQKSEKLDLLIQDFYKSTKGADMQ